MKYFKLIAAAFIAASIAWSPSPGFCRPPAGPLRKILGIVDEIPSPPKKKPAPDLPGAPHVSPPTGPNIPGDLPTKPGAKGPSRITPEETAILENLGGITNPKFGDVASDPSILPISVIGDTPPGAIDVKPPKVLPEKPGGVRNRQETTISLDPGSLGTDINKQFGGELDPLPQGAKPKIRFINHDYYDDYPPNFKVEVVYGGTDFVVGLDPKNTGGLVTIGSGRADFPPGSVLMPKDWYNDVLAGNVPDYRMGPAGKIQHLVDGHWIDYADPHWPYSK